MVLYSKEVNILDENGLHARPASQFVQVASKYKSEISIDYNGKILNGKSILSIISGGVKKGKITIIADGADEVEAVEALASMVENN